ncbi:MAG: hypothetical protein MRERV_80c008 [Mycoplasmataceae bacterium RV_VA103A]|nr:MAG: hypothetical protein MRERV_80c008 [Mycoplasmataceae bacterium RV_VA103A]
MLTILLTILITENIFLILTLLIWLNRHCKKCQQVKCIEQIFNKLCQKCQGQKPQTKKSYEL